MSVTQPEPEAESSDRFVAWFNAAAEASQQARDDAERDEDYYNNKQLTSDERKVLRDRGQPEVTVNHVRRKVDFILGTERQTRTDPKAFPRTPSEEGAAEAATDGLRYAADRGRFSQVKSKLTKNILIHGFGGAYVGVKRVGDTFEVDYKYIGWDRLFHDPHSCEPDFSDARYVGFVTWMDYDEAVTKYGEAGELVLETGRATEAAGGTYDDKPKWSNWYDSKRKRVRVAEIYFREDNAWQYCCFTRGGVLKPAMPVTYLDENGEPECPLVMVSAYIDRDNSRHGIVRDMVPVQDEINKRRSKSLHLLNMRQWAAQEGAVKNPDEISARLARPDGGIVTLGPVGESFKILDHNDMAQGNLALLQDAKADMTLMGPNAAMQGKDPRQQSGRAIQAQQQGGLVELTPILDALRDWQARMMRQTWNRIRQFWDGPKWIRVTDDDSGLKFVGFNVPITAGEAMIEQAKKTGQEIPPEMLAQMQADPAMQQIVGTRNDIAKLDVDIIIDEQPDVVTLQAETFESLANMVSAGMPIPPDALIEASPLPSKIKRTMLDKMQKAAQEPPKPDPATLAQLEVEKAKADAQAQQAQQKAQIEQRKAQADLALKGMEIEAQREQMAFEREKMAFELRRMEIQMQMDAHKAAFAAQANEQKLTAQREAAVN